MPSPRESHLSEVQAKIDAYYEQHHADMRPSTRRHQCASIAQILWRSGLTTKRNEGGLLRETVPLYAHVVQELWEDIQCLGGTERFNIVTQVITMLYAVSNAGNAYGMTDHEAGPKKTLTEVMLEKLRKTSAAKEPEPEQPKAEPVCFYSRCPGITKCHRGTGTCTMGS